jgi:VanZ family protein
VTKYLKYIFYILVLFLIIISLYPGSLLGYFFYGDFGQQPNLIKNPFGTTINHFICYLCISLLGLFLYSEMQNFKRIFYSLFFLSIILELLHLIIPNRSFEFGDIIGNILGVVVAYSVVKIYLYLKIHEKF